MEAANYSFTPECCVVILPILVKYLRLLEIHARTRTTHAQMHHTHAFARLMLKCHTHTHTRTHIFTNQSSKHFNINSINERIEP